MSPTPDQQHPRKLKDAERFGVCAPKGYYKPFKYNWAFEAYELQAHKMHWGPGQVSLADDVKDWERISAGERNLLTQLFRFFTTGDVDVGQAYLDKYIPIFQNEEVRMMLTAFANMESIHAHMYSQLLDTVGMPEVEYQAFREVGAMMAKHDYTSSFDVEDEADVCRALAVFSAFTEGLQLFSTFAMLMSFARGNRPGGAVMKGMNQIVAYSIRDESAHVAYMCRLFQTYVNEGRTHLWTKRLKGDLYGIAEAMVSLEDDFIDVAYDQGDTPGTPKEDVKKYIRFIGNRRLNQIGLRAIFDQEENPLPWIDVMMSAVEHMNFFENRATGYSHDALTGSFADSVWARRPSGLVVPTAAVA